jgi:hypothetical protein
MAAGAAQRNWFKLKFIWQPFPQATFVHVIFAFGLESSFGPIGELNK